MKQIISRRGWLVMAAAFMTGMSLTTGLTSCSSDDDVTQTAPQGVSTVHVSVGASVENAGTRSMVLEATDGGKTTRTLQFTTGDRLYVYGRITPDGMYPEMYIAGFLDNQATEDGITDATFSGDLAVYKMIQTYNPETGNDDLYKLKASTYYFGDNDPLAGTTATLFHDRASGNMFIDPDLKQVCFNEAAIGSSVDDLMTSLLEVKAEYNTSTKDFSLSPASGCIVGCTITNMPVTGYFKVSYWSGSSLSNLTKQTERDLEKQDADRPFPFAFFGKTGGNYYHQVRIESENYATRVIDLGRKTLTAGSGTNKIYNVSRSWDTFSITSNTSAAVPEPATTNNVSAYTFTSGCNINVNGAGDDKRIVLQGAENFVNIEDLTVINTTADYANGSFIVLYNNLGDDVATTINVKGSNSIICLAENKEAINDGNGNNTIKFSGNGTLTVTSKSQYNCGIYASNYNTSNNQNNVSGQCDVSEQLAATGCTVIRSARTYNSANGTYTWTYTVSTPFTVTSDKNYTTTWGTYRFTASYVTVSVSGTTDNERLEFSSSPVYITLNNIEVNQTSPVGNFIDSNDNDPQLSTTITINGNNSVNLSKLPVEHNGNAPANFIKCVGGLALIGNGTLTITTADPDNCGIIAANYPATDEAAKSTDAYEFPYSTGGLGKKYAYIVTRSARTDNGDGTYTWTYTVTPRNQN